MSTAEERGNKELEALRQLKGNAVEVRLDLLTANNSIHQLMGEARGLKSLSLVADAMMISKLKHVRETKLYKAALDPETGGNIKSFDRFCKMIGMDEHTVNEQIRVADRLGAQFLQLQMTGGLGLKREHVRLLLQAPSDLQAEATGVAVAMARGEDVAERLSALEDRIEDLTASHADKMKLIEQRAEAEEARGQAEDKAKKAEEKAKNEEKKRKEAERTAGDLAKEVETPPRLRTPEMARAFFDKGLLYGEAIGGRIEEAAETIGAHLAEGKPELVTALAQHVHDVACAVLNRVLMAYTYLVDVTGAIDAVAHPAMIALAGLVRGDGDLIRMARGVCEQMRKEGEERPAVAGIPKLCDACGQEFLAPTAMTKYCLDPECAKARQSEATA